MSADPKKCKTLIGSMAMLAGFPKDYPTAVQAMAKILSERSHNDAHAEYVVQQITETAERCPVISDFIRICGETRQRFAKPKPIGCANCEYGWIRIWLLTDETSSPWKHERIDRVSAFEMRGKLKPGVQRITEAVEMCSCVGERVAA